MLMIKNHFNWIIIFSLIFMGISCGDDDEKAPNKGSSTPQNAYSVAAITEIASQLKPGEIDGTDYYIKGKISKIQQVFGGTADFYISDNGTTTGQFFCNGVYYLQNQKYWGGRNIELGDEVVICGKVTNNHGSLETTKNRAYVYSLNGKTGPNNSSIEYSIDGKTFHTVLVEGGSMPPFYIMQTEIPISSDVIVNNRVVTPIDRTGDGIILKAEFRMFLWNLRNITNTYFRLPTKEEWQFAASGGNKTMGFIYSGSNTADDVAWYANNSDKKIHDIATKQPNELGLYDMSGNYAELCAIEGADDDDVDGIQCGGSWKDTASDCTVTSWKEGDRTGKVRPGSSINEKNAVDGNYISVRLVYTK